jgi:hypothetical protein
MSNRTPATNTRFANSLNYPWHFVVFSFVFMSRGYFLNKDLFAAEEAALYTLSCMLISMFIFMGLKRFIGVYKAGLLTSMYILIFFTYGIVYDGTDIFSITHFAGLRMVAIYLPYILIFLGLFTLMLFKVQKREYAIYRSSTTLLNIVALTMLGGTVSREINIALTIDSNPQTPSSVTAASTEAVMPERLPQTLPDVYYLIFDGYPSNDYLEAHWGIDNTAFTAQLESLGFYLADDSVSNYTYTAASLGSSLNMQYVQDFASAPATRSQLVPFVVDSEVAKIFQIMGYEYLVITSGYLPYSTIADMTIDVAQSGNLIYTPHGGEVPDARRSYLAYLYSTTFLRIFDPTLSAQPGRVAYWQSAVRTNPQLTALQQVADNDAPTFTLFHLTKPHGPVTLDRQGGRFEWSDDYPSLSAYLLQEEFHFADQLGYLNERILEAVEDILQQSSEPPIIIIQGDHGFQIQRLRPEFANSPIPILNAYYFPGEDYANLREDITPINSFRILLNQHFGFEYDLLPEVSYYQPSTAFNAESAPLEYAVIAEGQFEPPFSPQN